MCPTEASAVPLYVYPIAANATSSFANTHTGYPATDIFANCGVSVVAPVSGTISGLRRVDLWTQRTDNPWFRGGKFVGIVGDDGVRYYLAHLDTIGDGLATRSVVKVGQRIGTSPVTEILRWKSNNPDACGDQRQLP